MHLPILLFTFAIIVIRFRFEWRQGQAVSHFIKSKIMTIGEQLETERKRQNLTQDQLKIMAGISLDTLRRIEKNKSKNPSLFTIRAIEKALGITFEI